MASNEKVCSKCGLSLPYGMFHKDKSKPDGYYPSCKVCRYMFYSVKNRGRYLQKYKEYKRRNKDKIREYSAMYSRKNRDKKRLWNFRYRERNREYLRVMYPIWNKKYREKDPGRYKEIKKRWREANRDKIRERQRMRYASNPKVREKRKEFLKKYDMRGYLKKYFSTPHGKAIKARNRFLRRLRRKNNNCNVEIVDKNTLTELIRSAEVCYYCGKKLNGIFHIDHKIPISKGGADTLSNLAIACPACNIRKGNRTDSEFLALLEGGEYGYEKTVPGGMQQT